MEEQATLNEFIADPVRSAYLEAIEKLVRQRVLSAREMKPVIDDLMQRLEDYEKRTYPGYERKAK